MAPDEQSLISDAPETGFTLFHGLCALLLILALFTRFYDLSSKPPHHDESMHAFYSLQLLQQGQYEYVPFMHGPFQFCGNAVMFFLFGPSTAVSRYLAAFLGSLTILLALWMGPFLGRTGSILAAVLLVCSPTFMYFNRFCREDTYAAAGTLARVVFLMRYLHSQKKWELWLASLGFTVAYCSKESIFLTLLIFLTFLGFNAIRRENSSAAENEEPSNLSEKFNLAAVGGAVAIFGVGFLLFYTAFFNVGSHLTFPERLSAVVRSLYNGAFGCVLYWIGQHSVHRGDQPFYYYILMLLIYEPLVFLFSTAAAVYYFFFSRKTVPFFLAYWFVGSFLLFSWFGEKMPWLTLHIALPGILLAAYFFGEIWDSRPTDPNLSILRVSALALFGLLLSYSLFTAVRLSFRYPADPVEPYVYVQSGPDCLEVEKIIRKISTGETGGSQISVAIEDKCSWPLAWLLQDFKNRIHPSEITSVKTPIVVSAMESDASEYPVLKQAGYVNRKYKMRVWWVSSWFKSGSYAQSLSPELFISWFLGNILGIVTPRADMVDRKDLWEWVVHRKVWSDEGSYNMRLWIQSDLAQKYGFTDDHRADIPSQYP